MTKPCIEVTMSGGVDDPYSDYISVSLRLKDENYLLHSSENSIEDLDRGEAEVLLDQANAIAKELNLPCEVSDDVKQLVVDGRKETP